MNGNETGNFYISSPANETGTGPYLVTGMIPRREKIYVDLQAQIICIHLIQFPIHLSSLEAQLEGLVLMLFEDFYCLIRW